MRIRKMSHYKYLLIKKYIFFNVYVRCLNKYLIGAVFTAIICGTMIFNGYINVFTILLIAYSYVIIVWLPINLKSFFIHKKMITDEKFSKNLTLYKLIGEKLNKGNR